jgi:DNA polymerase-3 subunit delta'
MLDEVQGQDEGVRYLRHVVAGRVTSPLLLIGEEGVGRRFAVMQTILEMFCTGSKQSRCRCPDCTQVRQGVHPDLLVVEAGAKDIGVDAIRDALEQASSYPSVAPVRAFLIDGADRMTMPAANAFLKTLEEPPSTTRFFLLAENERRVIPTIRSRCGRVAFRRLPESAVLSVLSQHCSDAAKALVYCRIAEGSLGRAIRYWGSGRLSLRDKVFSILTLGLKGDLPSLFAAIDALDKELPLGLRLLEQLLLDLAMIQHDPARIINQDIADKLSGVRVQRDVWQRLVTGLRDIRATHRTTHIVLPFHVKALFAAVIGV